MGWFEEQIKIRKQSDREAFEDSCLLIAGSIMGQRLSAALHDEREQTTDAIGQVLRYYRVRSREVPDKLKSIDDVLEYLLRPCGIMTREVTLTDGWRHDASGAMLTTFASDGRPVALIPAGMNGYRYLNPATGVMERVKHDTESLFSTEAIAFYKPFPNERLSIGDVYKYIFDSIDKKSLGGYLFFAFLATLVGMIIPWLTRLLFDGVAGTGSVSALITIAIFMICSSVSSVIFGTVQELYLQRISLKLDMNIESATMMRILTLPTEFFRQYASGDLANRVQYMNMLVTQLVNMGLSSLVIALFSFLYVFQIFAFAPAIAVPALLITVSVLVINILSVVVRSRVNRTQMELASRESGLSFALVSGIEKIKLSGAERRAFAKWGKSYSEQAALVYDPPFFVKISGAIAAIIPLIGTVIIYYLAVRAQVDVGRFYAFNSAYGMVTGAFGALAMIVAPASQVGPILEMVRPIMEAVPEVAEDKPVIERLSGGVELTNVTFRYQDDAPPVLDNINLKIRPGQYVAVTGKTGCGKSTLMRVMLGFETPQRGAVYYDGRDLKRIDLKSLRSRIGIVMQNSELFMGDIYSNIVISAPQLTIDDAWEAAEIAGLADDIRAMPMEMHTVISEGSGGISGGQKQRMMIARAIAPKPKILMLDEATSALDNITQKQVSDSLDALACTRIVIAHRLSTIRNCDRIIVLDSGHIVEDGTYEELMAKDGFFAELVRRQQVDQQTDEQEVLVCEN